MAITQEVLNSAGQVLAAAATVREAAATWRASDPGLRAVVVDALDMRDEKPALRCGARSIYLATFTGHCWAITRQMDDANALILTQDET